MVSLPISRIQYLLRPFMGTRLPGTDVEFFRRLELIFAGLWRQSSIELSHYYHFVGGLILDLDAL